MIWVIVLVVLVLIVALAAVVIYNRLVRLRNRAENSWAQVDVQLRRRYDLIPNLVEAVKGYAAHERGTFDEVTQARTAAQQAKGVAQQAEAENVLTAAIGRLFAVAEAYPQLRATENFQQLQAQLAETEQKIAVSRQVYNDAVLTYDNALETVPTNIVAGLFNFSPRRTSRRKALRGRRRPCSSPTEPARLRTPPPRRGRAALARRRRREVVLAPGRGRRRADPVGRVAPRARADHVRLLGRLQRRVPRHPAPLGRVDRQRRRRRRKR